MSRFRKPSRDDEPAGPEGTAGASPAREEQPQSSPTSGKSAGRSGSRKARGKDDEEQPRRGDGMRETIESIVVAFILAFLFRTFEAEAFVIPTGSMAPTLRGRHKEITCDQCNYRFAIGASGEIDPNTQMYNPLGRVTAAFCPNCRYRNDGTGPESVENLPVFKGDRILVTKYPYEFGDPERWDVVVFKFPEDPKTNYIKRLVGLPGETLMLRQGDVYRLNAEGAPEILRKDDPYKQRQLQLPVYDDRYPPRSLLEAGWPERWAAVRTGDSPEAIAGWVRDESGWTMDAADRSYTLTPEHATATESKWLRYRHFIPAGEDWEAVLNNSSPTANPRPRLITDFCGYNAFTSAYDGQHHTEFDDALYWVGDLTISGQLDVQHAGENGELILELNEGFRRYRCVIDVATGHAELKHSVDQRHADDEDEWVSLGTAETDLQGTGEYSFRFANVDDRLCLWIDGDLVEFDGANGIYSPFGGSTMVQPATRQDLIPAGIAARNLGVQVSGLLLERDIYYRNEFKNPSAQYYDDDRHGNIDEWTGSDHQLREQLTDPEQYSELYRTRLSANLRQPGDPYEGVPFYFELGEDEFFMMGDNSPRSKDSRLWANVRKATHRYAVPRTALVGKAFFVYWPHGVPFLNDGRGYPDDENSILHNPLTDWLFYHREQMFDEDGTPVVKRRYPRFRIPFYPDFGRMRRIR